ncbi:hypothetical protein HELRODRAFT_166041 [Helobdella robusta]|uniref:Uncharacterized protein n=1 Tax=Helobdella robusta TaxID=6412 RepID=T1EXM6_HELRO|nr:hypothetical protein HELRODRAFT_166041 [Helobdella robusta]ESN90379.1 hypothetical protein HELRODRAFT_166041 [Helobdella robusta]
MQQIKRIRCVWMNKHVYTCMYVTSCTVHSTQVVQFNSHKLYSSHKHTQLCFTDNSCLTFGPKLRCKHDSSQVHETLAYIHVAHIRRMLEKLQNSKSMNEEYEGSMKLMDILLLKKPKCLVAECVCVSLPLPRLWFKSCSFCRFIRIADSRPTQPSFLPRINSLCGEDGCFKY